MAGAMTFASGLRLHFVDRCPQPARQAEEKNHGWEIMCPPNWRPDPDSAGLCRVVSSVKSFADATSSQCG
jgi:hypothetical protein